MLNLLNSKIGEKKEFSNIYVYYDKTINLPSKLDSEIVDTNIIMTDVYIGLCQIINLLIYIQQNINPEIFQYVQLIPTDTSKSPDIYAISKNTIYKYADVVTLIKYMFS